MDPVVTLLQRDVNATHPWIIFKIEAAKFLNDDHPESQVYYIVQGDASLYTNFVAVKKPTLSKEFCDKWMKVFKASGLVYK